VAVRMRVLVTVEPDTAAGNPPAPVAADPRSFAVLLVHAGEVVSVDRARRRAVGRDLPAHPTSAVHNLVSRVQFAVHSAGASDTVRILTRAPGYLLEADPRCR
jgi:hypothetical protein